MTRREQIEDLITQHLRISVYKVEDYQKSIFLTSRQEFVDALCCALAPTPDDATLLDIVGSLHGNCHDAPGWGWETHCVLCQRALSRLRAWAGGTESKREWCKHLQWGYGGACEAQIGGQKHWVKTGQSYEYASDTWTVCPICQAKRPT